MKIQRHFTCEPSGVPVTGAIRNQDAKLGFKGRDLLIKRINPVSPAAVEKNERLAAAKLPVMDGDWTDARCVGELGNSKVGT
jgi:hypothetical protein